MLGSALFSVNVWGFVFLPIDSVTVVTVGVTGEHPQEQSLLCGMKPRFYQVLRFGSVQFVKHENGYFPISILKICRTTPFCPVFSLHHYLFRYPAH